MPLPDTPGRVPSHTPRDVNRRIARRTAESLRWHEAHPQRIGQRLRELDEEWDVERALEANAASLAMFGSALALALDRRWAAVPLVVAGFLFQHATQGWCPPLPVMRRLGFRTSREIDHERYALKALRGDFGRLEAPGDGRDTRSGHALQAAAS